MPVAFEYGVYSHYLFCSESLTCNVGSRVAVRSVEREVNTRAVAHAEDPAEAEIFKLESMILAAAAAIACCELVVSRSGPVENVIEALVRHAAYVEEPSMSAALYGAIPSGILQYRDVRGMHELADVLADEDRRMLDVLAEIDEAALPPETPYNDYESEAGSQGGCKSDAT